jgi:hypothetical protein
MPEVKLQIEFLEQIISRYTRKMEAVDDLCQILNTSRDPIYRRLRGDTALTPDEMVLLARRFNISLDKIVFGKTNEVLFNFNAFSQPVQSFADYLTNFQRNLEQIRRLPGAHLFYTSAEIPIFSYMYFPELLCFKLYVWGRTTWNLKFLEGRKFDFDLISPHDLRTAQSLVEHYNAIESTELWSQTIADNTLAQIEYHLHSGGFRDGQVALRLCERLLDWAAHLKNIAATGKKFVPGRQANEHHAPAHIFHNEMIYTNNTVLIKSQVNRVFFAALCNPDFVMTYDDAMCDHIENWFATMLGKSTNITHDSEKNREWFFRGLTKKIETAKKRVELFLGEE